VTGNVKLLVVNNSGGFYLALTPYNYRAGITKVEIKSNSSSTWVNMPRSAANRFEYNTGTALVFPVQVRVTSRFGEIVTFLPIASMATDQRIAGTTQFTTFPALAPTPAVKMSPVYTDSFSSVPGDSWSASPYSGATVNAAFTGAHHEGSACIQLSALGGFNGVRSLEIRHALCHGNPGDNPRHHVLRNERRWRERDLSHCPAATTDECLAGLSNSHGDRRYAGENH